MRLRAPRPRIVPLTRRTQLPTPPAAPLAHRSPVKTGYCVTACNGTLDINPRFMSPARLLAGQSMEDETREKVRVCVCQLLSSLAPAPRPQQTPPQSASLVL